MFDRKQLGSASVEYAVVTTVVIGVLFAPLPGLDASIVDYTLDALRGFQANTTFLLSLP